MCHEGMRHFVQGYLLYIETAGVGVRTQTLLAGKANPLIQLTLLTNTPTQYVWVCVVGCHWLWIPLWTGMSLLERLMDTMPVYRKLDEDEEEEDDVSDGDSEQEAFDPRFVTKLLCNYRFVLFNSLYNDSYSRVTLVFDMSWLSRWFWCCCLPPQVSPCHPEGPQRALLSRGAPGVCGRSPPQLLLLVGAPSREGNEHTCIHTW